MPQSIENTLVKITYDATTSSFLLSVVCLGHVFVTSGTLPGIVGQMRNTRIHDPHFGTGKALEIKSTEGTAWLMLFPRFPFVLIRRTLVNNGTAPLTRNRVPIVELPLDLGKPAQAVKVLGTGGLTAADANPGSYGWLTVADPSSGGGVVVGWISHERASGVLFPRVVDDAVHVQARADYGRLSIAPGASAESETLAIGWFDDARLGMEAWADATARVYGVQLPAQPTGFCTWYAEKHGGSSDETSLATLAEIAARELKPVGFDFVQIDDGWQRGDSKGNGPHKDFTDFSPTGPYPSGMKAIADTIKAKGLRPGIWFMPFAGTYNDPLFAGHQEWFIKTADGKPYDTRWGGTCLDMTQTGTREHLRSVVARIAGEWGYTYFKMDGLYTGIGVQQNYVNSGYKDDDLGDTALADPTKTHIEAFRDGLRLVRETVGPDVFFLGCTAAQNMRSYTGAFGLVDAMRTGADNDGSWQGWARESPVSGSRNYHLNGRIWYNDPDPEYVRASLTLDEARTIATWPAIAGQLHSNSDWIPDLSPERLDILRRTLRPHGRIARPVDLFEHDPPRLWLVTDDHSKPRRDVIAAYNFDDSPLTLDEPLQHFGLPPADKYIAFDYWNDTLLPPLTDSLQLTLSPHGCVVLSIRPALDRPMLISTSAHATQGMLEVSEEKWNTRRQELTGHSKLIGGQNYVLRFAKPPGWRLVSSGLMSHNSFGGVRSDVMESETMIWFSLSPKSSCSIQWHVRFGRRIGIQGGW